MSKKGKTVERTCEKINEKVKIVLEVEAVKTANGIVGIWGDNVCLNNNKCNTEICPIILEEAQKEQKRQKEIIMNQMEREKK